MSQTSHFLLGTSRVAMATTLMSKYKPVPKVSNLDLVVAGKLFLGEEEEKMKGKKALIIFRLYFLVTQYFCPRQEWKGETAAL